MTDHPPSHTTSGQPAPERPGEPGDGVPPLALSGAGHARVEAVAKVTGAARYAGDVQLDAMAEAVLVTSAIAKGRLTAIDTTAAEASSGVLRILTHRDPPALEPLPVYPAGPAGQSLLPLQDATIHHYGQIVAVVVAESFEQAAWAASLVRAEYQAEAARVTIGQGLEAAYVPGDAVSVDHRRGDVEDALAAAPVRLDAVYATPGHGHNPIEPTASVVRWEDGCLHVHEPTQWVAGLRAALAGWLGLELEAVRVSSPYVGGSFGAKSVPWPHSVFAAIAARELGRPVRLVLTREQMYLLSGHRPASEQHLALGAERDGALTAIRLDVYSETGGDDFLTFVTGPARSTYCSPNARTTLHQVPLDVPMPSSMRAPGEAEGSFAMESAIDELAAQLGMDPLELRRRNFTDEDPSVGLPWSSNRLLECYELAAERFGWGDRPLQPRSLRDGDLLVGWGMATAAYPLFLSPAAASVAVEPDARVVVASGTHELGQGSTTMLAQVAAETLGVPIATVTARLGDSTLPPAPLSAGSRTTASVGPAVAYAAAGLRERLVRLAVADPASPLLGADAEEVDLVDGELRLRATGRRERLAELVRRHPDADLRVRYDHSPPGTDEDTRRAIYGGGEGAAGPELEDRAMHSFGAIFIEVAVDEAIGRWHVRRIVGAYDAGRVVNRRTARGQLAGAITLGIGMAFTEEIGIDARVGRYVNNNIADYHIPVQADIPPMELHLVDGFEPVTAPLGTKPIAELGTTGTAAAVANAVFHATGRRHRTLPILPEHLLAP